MQDSPTNSVDPILSDDPDAPARPTPLFWHSPRTTLAAQLLFLSFVLLSIAWLLTLLLRREPIPWDWSVQVLIAIAAILCSSGAALVRREYWQRPMNRLLQLVTAIQEGEAPIEELSTVTGGIEPLAPIFQTLLSNLRAQRAKLAELELEMSQRVTSRTNAIERRLGVVQIQAQRDILTGLLNRGALETHLPQATAILRDEGTSLCALMIDVDNFKVLNDTLGHAAGDEFLRQLGQIVKSNIREQDLAFRYGGDELIIFLSGANAATGEALAKRLAQLVEQMGRTLKVTHKPKLSIGVCASSELEAPTAPGLLEVADRRLYAIKATRPRIRKAS